MKRAHVNRLIVGAAALVAVVAFAPLALRAGFPGLDKLPSIPGVPGIPGGVQDKIDKGSKILEGATGIPLEKEIQIGDAVSLEIVSRYGGLWRDRTATRHINVVGKSLARYAARQDLDWRFGILNSDAVNAFSAPGGRVFITRGLFKLAQTDDELAGILAHEIAHIDRRHALKIIARGEFISGVSDVVSDNNAEFAKYEDAINSITKELLDKGYDPDSEYDADKRGRNLAKVTGFAPGGLRAALEALQKTPAGKAPQTFSTHPKLPERIKRLPKDPPPPPAAPIAYPETKN